MIELEGVKARGDVSVGWNLNPIVKFFIHWNNFHNQKASQLRVINLEFCIRKNFLDNNLIIH